MKKYIIPLIICITCLLSSSLLAQPGHDNHDDQNSRPSISFAETLTMAQRIVENESNNEIQNVEARAYMEIDKSLQGFLATPLIDKLKELKIDVESLIITFKTRQGDFEVEDIINIQNAYETFANDYNTVLLQIKSDFMNRKQRKAISKNPNWYAATLELQFRNLKDNYSQNLLQGVANLTGSDQYSAFPLIAILGMIELTRDFVNHLARINYEGKKIREQHLNQFFIEPYSMKQWRDIETIPSSSQNSNSQYDFEGQANPFNNPYENKNPFGEEVRDTTSNYKKQ